MKINSFKKEERLCSKKLINELFVNGKTFVISPFKVIRLNTEFDEKVKSKLLISIPSYKVKQAVDRNKLKRQIREAFRKNKHQLYKFLEENNKQLVFGILYNTKELLTYSETELKIILILQRLEKELKNDYEMALK